MGWFELRGQGRIAPPLATPHGPRYTARKPKGPVIETTLSEEVAAPT